MRKCPVRVNGDGEAEEKDLERCKTYCLKDGDTKGCILMNIPGKCVGDREKFRLEEVYAKRGYTKS